MHFHRDFYIYIVSGFVSRWSPCCAAIFSTVAVNKPLPLNAEHMASYEHRIFLCLKTSAEGAGKDAFYKTTTRRRQISHILHIVPF